jgi:hypothetical protein
MASVLDRRWIYAAATRKDASVSSPLRHLPGRSSPVAKAKTDQSQLQENLERLKGRCTMYKYGSNYEVL